MRTITVKGTGNVSARPDYIILLAMQGDEKLPSLKTLQAEQQRLLEEQQRLYDERAKLKKEARMIDTMKANVDIFLKPSVVQEPEQIRDNQRE